MAYQNIYSTQLLNDIHNYLPEILYNRHRFQTVPDLLSYIHEVSEISSYSRGLQQYRIQQSYNRYNRYNENIANIRRSETPNTDIPQVPGTTASSTASSIASLHNIDRALNNVLDEVSFIFGSRNLEQSLDEYLQSFINQPVIVRPTPTEIQNASNTFAVTERQEDNCAICQDEIIIDQQIRRLTHCSHYFHKVCIDSWFLQNVHCPTCRHDIRNVSTV